MRPRRVPLDAGKELFTGELLVTKQGKLAKKALPVRAHDSRFYGSLRRQRQPEMLQIARERHGTGNAVMRQDKAFIPDPDLSIHLVEDGFAIITDIHPHQRRAIVDGDIVPLGIQPDQNGQACGVKEGWAADRLLGHFLQIECTEGETGIKAGDRTKEIIKNPVRMQGAVWRRSFQFAVRKKTAAAKARPSSPAEERILRITCLQDSFLPLGQICRGVGQHTAKCKRT